MLRRFVGRWCDEDASSLHIQENQNEDVSKTGLETIFLEKNRTATWFLHGVSELIPVPGPRWAGFVSVEFEDFLDRVW